MTIHIATSMCLASVVRIGLGVPVTFVPDNWMMGPWPTERNQIPRDRCDFWSLRGQERTKALDEYRSLMRVIESNDRLTIWMSRLGSDTLAFWAICAWRLQVFPDQPNMELVVLGGPTEAEDPLGVAPGIIQSTPEEAQNSAGDRRNLSRTRVQTIARLWRRICKSVPLLATRYDTSTLDRQRLQMLGEHQAWFLPRVDEKGLRLSRFDDLLFKNISRRGSTPVDVIVHSGKTGEELRRWMSVVGDLFIANRLAQWAAHGGKDAALLSEPHRADRVMLAAKYRLSDAGRAILRNGLDEMGQGVPLPVWGVTAYDPNSPWVVVENESEGLRVKRYLGRRKQG